MYACECDLRCFAIVPESTRADHEFVDCGRPPFAVEAHRALFASEAKLLSDLVMIQQVIASAKKEGKEIYSLLVPALMQSLQTVELEVLGCLGELLNRIGPTKSVDKGMDEMERGAGGGERRFAPLRMNIMLESCKQDLLQVLTKVVTEHLGHRNPAREPVLSNMDIIDLLAFFFNVTQFIGGVCTLWQNVLLLLHTEKLYFRNIDATTNNSPLCNRLANFLASL